MNHSDHVRLIEQTITSGGVWADLGSGWGAFTLALREVAGEGVEIYSVDRDERALAEQKRHFAQQFPGSNIHFVVADFRLPLDLPLIDGVIMANSLHFVPVEQQAEVLARIAGYLKPDGRLIMVEYDSKDGNAWVPYPISFQRLNQLAANIHFPPFERIGTEPSRFMHAIYAAVSIGSGDVAQ